MGPEIRSCLESDVPELFGLFKELYRYNPNMVKREYFDWFFKATPFSIRQGYEFYISRESGTIKAFLGCVPMEYRLDGKIEKGCWITSWHSFSAGFYGIQLWLYLKELYGTVFLMGLTDRAISIYRAMGITIVDRLGRWIGVLDKKSCRETVGPADGTWEIFPEISYDEGKEVFFIERFEANEEFLLEEVLGVRGYCRRTGRFLNWRFKDIPDHNYQMLRSGNGQYGVFRIEKIKGCEQAVTRIIEWTFDQRLGKQAMRLVCEAGRLENSILVDFFSSSPCAGKSLEACGFLAESDISFDVPRLFRPVKDDDGISFGIDRTAGPVAQQMYTDWYMTTAELDSERIKL